MGIHVDRVRSYAPRRRLMPLLLAGASLAIAGVGPAQAQQTSPSTAAGAQAEAADRGPQSAQDGAVSSGAGGTAAPAANSATGSPGQIGADADAASTESGDIVVTGYRRSI